MPGRSRRVCHRRGAGQSEGQRSHTADAAPCPARAPCSYRPLPPWALPEAPHSPGDSSPCPGRGVPHGPGAAPALRAPALTCPLPRHSAGLRGRAGLAAGAPKQTRGGSARPRCRGLGRANKRAPCAAGSVSCVPASPPCEPHAPGHPPPWDLGQAGAPDGGAELTGPNLRQATATPAQNVLAGGWDVKSGGLPGSGRLLVVGSQQWRAPRG